ncbi:branched-chain amino acid transport system ATP-binding protein [Rhizobiales bacterium GAS113]|nr:branched-chain amino acid transport system ATP-binding protein [Rhizobiales bacterium GAS113]
MPDPLLRIDDLVVRYGLAQAVRMVSLSVGRGEIVGILGRNGAGKTTLLRAISGLIQVASGSVRFEEKDITNWRGDRIARLGVSHVLEHRGIFGDLSVDENLMASLTGISRQAGERRIAEVLEEFPWLKERRKQLGAGLSGGQQQMVAIARALLRGPRVLLLDEPSKGLAPAVVDQVSSVLLRKVAETGMGILLVEQSFDLLWSLSHRICVLAEGGIVLGGEKTSLSPQSLQAAYFGNAGKASAPFSEPLTQ